MHYGLLILYHIIYAPTSNTYLQLIVPTALQYIPVEQLLSSVAAAHGHERSETREIV